MATSAGKRKRPIHLPRTSDKLVEPTIRTVYVSPSLDGVDNGRWSLLLSLPGDLIRHIINDHCNEHDRVVLRHVCYTHLFTRLPNLHQWHIWGAKGVAWLKYAIKTCSSYSLASWIVQRGMVGMDPEQCIRWAASASNWPVIDMLRTRLVQDDDHEYCDSFVLDTVLDHVKTLEMAKQSIVHPLVVASPKRISECWEPALQHQNLDMLNWLHERKVPYKASYARSALYRGAIAAIEWLLQHGYMLPDACEIVPASLAGRLHQSGMTGISFSHIISRENDFELLCWALRNGHLDAPEDQIYLICDGICQNRIDRLKHMLLDKHLTFPSASDLAHASKLSCSIDFTTAKWLDDHGYMSSIPRTHRHPFTLSAAQRLDIQFLQFLADREFHLDVVACTRAIIEPNMKEPTVLDQTHQTLDWLWRRNDSFDMAATMNKLRRCICDLFDYRQMHYVLCWFANHIVYGPPFRAEWNRMEPQDKFSLTVSIRKELEDGPAKLNSLITLDLWPKGEHTGKTFYGAARNGNLAVMQILLDNYGFRYKIDKLIHTCSHSPSIRNLVLAWAAKNPAGAQSKKPRHANT